MQPKQKAFIGVKYFFSFSVKVETLLSTAFIISPLPAIAQKIPISNDGIFLESASVRYNGKFVYFQTEKLNMFYRYGDVRRTVVDHVMDCRTGYWQISRAIGYTDSYIEPNVDLTGELQGKTFFAEPGTPSGNLYKALCR